MKVGIVGAGIFGLAHAWAAARRGHEVTLFERSPRSSGGSIRNFGMVWPIGQPAGEFYQTALRSRESWLELAREAGIWVNDCGSIHLAHRDDEWALLEEFAAQSSSSQSSSLGFDVELLSPAQVLERTPGANPQGLKGGLLSRTELCVNPPVAVRSLARWLAERWNVRFHFCTAVTAIEGNRMVTAAESASRNHSPAAASPNSPQHRFDHILVCSGADLRTLFPESLSGQGLKICKLQMMRTVAQSHGWRLNTHLASGLTLRHYDCFKACQTLPALKARVASETPELDRYGIHVMASQNDAGEVILGDSHEYDDDIEPFDKQLIDQLMLRELQKVFALPDWTLGERWHGYYCKNPAGPVFKAEPTACVSVRTGAGGSGMTMAFGLAEREWESR